jgi:hypothetical protein
MWAVWIASLKTVIKKCIPKEWIRIPPIGEMRVPCQGCGSLNVLLQEPDQNT